MVSILLILFFNNAFERYIVSAHAAALGNAYTASALDIDAIRFNPADLSFVQKNHFAVGYEYTLSGLEGLHNISLGYARPLFIGGVGVQLSEFGFSEQKEQAITFAYGLKLSKDFKFGLGTDIYVINNRRTGNAFSYSLNIGFLGALYKRWYLGIYGHNLNQPQFGNTEYGKLPYELRAGLGYTPFNDILSEVDLSMYGDQLRIHLAGEFTLFDIAHLRTGLKTNPAVVSAGLGIVYKFIELDYAIEYVPELPLNHGVTLEFEF
jgi:hypothetical protein